MTIRGLTLPLTVAAVALLLVAAIPKWRTATRDLLIPDQRTLVAKVDGDITPVGPKVIVLKIKTRDQFFLEIYKNNASLELIQRIALDEPLDGRFYFQGNYTNLALIDMNGDSNFEIVSPMFDRNSVPRLLLFRFNPSLQSFERLTADESSQNF
jgi:hypothetical protein